MLQHLQSALFGRVESGKTQAGADERQQGEAEHDEAYVKEKLAWMRARQIWPNGERYLWTDAFGVVLLTSLYEQSGDAAYLRQAEEVVAAVNATLRRPLGIRIGESKPGQYYHYLTIWWFALARLGRFVPKCIDEGVALVKEVHSRFVTPHGIHWRMTEDLSAPYPGSSGFGSMDQFEGYLAYRLLDPTGTRLGLETGELAQLIVATSKTVEVEQDLGLGMLLWATSFFPVEPWAAELRQRCLASLAGMWVDQGSRGGYYCRMPWARGTAYAFTNYGISVGLQAAKVWRAHVRKLNAFFEGFRHADDPALDTDAITHVMACSSRFPGLLLPQPGDAEAVGGHGGGTSLSVGAFAAGQGPREYAGGRRVTDSDKV